MANSRRFNIPSKANVSITVEASVPKGEELHDDTSTEEVQAASDELVNPETEQQQEPTLETKEEEGLVSLLVLSAHDEPCVMEMTGRDAFDQLVAWLFLHQVHIEKTKKAGLIEYVVRLDTI